MEEKPLTLEDLLSLEKEFTTTDFENFKAVPALAGAPDLTKICELYKKLRPVIALLLGWSLIPPFVKKAIKALMALLDQLCG